MRIKRIAVAITLLLITSGYAEVAGGTRASRSARSVGQAFNPSPAHQTHGLTFDFQTVTLSWTGDARVSQYHVYWGPSAEHLTLIGQTADNTLESPPLMPAQRYLWRVDSVDSAGAVVTGSLWQFSTAVPAFPTAEGFGRWATGGRGGTVYHVTNLNDSGPGSFRDAVSGSHRTVVFDVGGIIRIDSRIVIQRNVTVAGQTAPGGGITLYGNGIALNGDSGNNIIRHLRIRMGRGGDSGKDAIGISAGQNYLFDHVSVSWGRDGTVDINGSGIDNITLQDCIIAQGLHSHSTGGLMQSGKASVLRTLYIDNHTRNPKGRGIQQYVNNVVYNWRVSAYILGDTAGLSEANIQGNYFINGPSTSSNCFNRATPSFHAYVSDNWHDANRNGVLDGTDVTTAGYGPITFEAHPYDYPEVRQILSPTAAWHHIVASAGASQVRDEVDDYLIAQLRSLGTLGSIIAHENENPISDAVGTVAPGPAPLDTDQDGMPDTWEIALGSDPLTMDHNLDNDDNGYSNLEDYLHWLGQRHVTTPAGVSLDIDLAACHSLFSPDLSYAVGRVSHGTAALLKDGHTVCFVPAQGYSGTAKLAFDVTVPDGSTIRETIAILVE